MLGGAEGLKFRFSSPRTGKGLVPLLGGWCRSQLCCGCLIPGQAVPLAQPPPLQSVGLGHLIVKPIHAKALRTPPGMWREPPIRGLCHEARAECWDGNGARLEFKAGREKQRQHHEFRW